MSATRSALRVLHCPDCIGGHPPALAAAERALGLDSRAVTLRPHRFGYNADEVLTNGGRIAVELARWRLLWRALRWADVVHFNFGLSTMPQRTPLDGPRSARSKRWLRQIYNVYAGALELRDLRWLTRAGKKIVVTYQGDDARQADVLRATYEIHPADDVDYYSDDADRFKRERIAAFALHASAIFALNPDLLRVLPEGARFLPYAVPPVRPVGGIGPIPDKERPVLAHAPSDRGVKGTRFLLEAVNRLREEGVRFDFMLIEGVPHEEAMRRYAHADLFVDQLLAGWYGGVAVELMALRKPVVCYLREADLQVIPPAMQAQIPIIQATPSTIYEVLKRWLTTPRSELASRGALGPAFVSRWHDPRAIAELTRETYLRITGAQLGTAAAA